MTITGLLDQDVQGRWIWLTAGLLFILAFLLFDQTFAFDFTQYDDFLVIGNHPQLFSDGSLLERFKQIVYVDYPRLEPLIVRDLTWLLDSEVFGFNNPFGYHLGNVVYHAITIVLAFFLFLKLTRFSVAVLTMMIVLVLAVHVEPVAWIMGRKDILASMFSILSILFFLCISQYDQGWQRSVVYVISMLCAIAAYLSKINAVVLPGVILLCAAINNRELIQSGFKASDLKNFSELTIKRLIPFFIIALAVFIWYQQNQQNYGLVDLALQYTPDDIKRLIFILNPLILFEYLSLILFPDQLSAYYTQPSLNHVFSSAEVILAVSVIAALFGTVVILWRINRVSCLLFLCFLVLMLPYANWKHFGFWYANRYVYFSSMFLILGIVNFASSIIASNQKNWLKITAGLFLTLIFTANLLYRWDYVDVWRDGGTLWTHDIGLDHPTLRAFNSLTAFYMFKAEQAPEDKDNWLNQALAVCEKATSRDWPGVDASRLALNYFYKGVVLDRLEAPLKQRLEAFRNVVILQPDHAPAHLTVAKLYYDIALQEPSPEQKIWLANESLTSLRKHFRTRKAGEDVTELKLEMMTTLKSSFPSLVIPEIEATDRKE